MSPAGSKPLRHQLGSPFTSGSVSQYDVGAGGTLSPKSPATVAAGAGPAAVVVSPPSPRTDQQGAMQERPLGGIFPAVQEPGAVHRVREPRLLKERPRPAGMSE